MKKNDLLAIATILLLILGIYMIYLGTKANILPPTVTGAGFVIIAAVFWKLRS